MGDFIESLLRLVMAMFAVAFAALFFITMAAVATALWAVLR